ncbi:MAG: phosphoribosylanthranilate isomerase [Solirubrobacteraceae bacterium]|nr:phosphoribosylanthranilate isomerase [Solirubrobacterales bacterium]MEA2214508.1 phosphoribosylanthranilate isomerase [Solirubrobacteraceae bacterium]
MATRVKICGLTNLADAEAAADLGAWALGMIFYEGSPRRCSLEEAQVIAASLRRRVELCAVFVNAPLDQIVRIGEEVGGLSMVQLHGDEGPAFCEEARRRTGARVIKAKQVSVPADVRELERFHVDFHLVDAHARALGRAGMRGGTGETFDWGLLGTRRSKVPLILSGGIDAGNAAAAIAAVHPYALDSASGTESAPGHKDHERMAALFAAVREADALDAAAAASGIGQPA